MLQSDLEELKKAYYRGVLKVREGDTWVEYQSMKEMRVAISDAERELSGNKASSVRIARTSNGYR